MLIDITLPITPELLADARTNTNPALVGHLGTHFDAMNRSFPLEYTRRSAVMFDVSAIKDRDIEASDIDMEAVTRNMFILFYSGYIEEEPYGSKAYFSHHPQLSHTLIYTLVEKGVSLIGLDFGGVRRGAEHIPADQFCADNGVFIIENLCNLKTVLAAGGRFTAHTYPLNCTGITGLPCRVIAEV